MVKIYKNIEDYNPNKRRKKLIFFDDMMADMLSDKKLNATELFIRGRKLDIPLVFIAQPDFAVPKDIRINSMHYFIIKFQINENLLKLHPIIYQILTYKNLRIFMKSVWKNHILFWLPIILLHQIIL